MTHLMTNRNKKKMLKAILRNTLNYPNVKRKRMDWILCARKGAIILAITIDQLRHCWQQANGNIK